MLLRDGRAESALLDFFSDAGFVVRGGRIVLKRSKEILRFCTQGVAELGKLCEVYASTALKRSSPGASLLAPRSICAADGWCLSCWRKGGLCRNCCR